MKKKIMISYFNSAKVGGPNNAMRRISDSFLKEKYSFVPIRIDGKLGKFFRLKILMGLIKEIKAEKPDVIYFTGMQLHGFYMALATFLAGYKKKTIMVVRGSSCDALNISRPMRVLFRKIIEPLTVRMVGMVHTVCSEMAENPIVKKHSKNFYGVIHNAAPNVELNRYDRKSFRKQHGIKDDACLLVYTGRIVYDKGINYLMEAISNIDCCLALVGDGQIEYYDALAKKLGIESKVIFTGPQKDVFEWLTAGDVYVFPTLHENLSNALLEACVAGLPVIATNVGGNPEVIRSGVDGILVEPQNTIELHNAIQQIISDEMLREKFIENAMQRVQEKFSAKVIYSQIDEMFMHVIRKNTD